MNQPVTEQELAAAAVAPRVTAADITSKMSKLTFLVQHFPGTTVTVAVAMLGDFMLATGCSACVSRENYNADFGKRLAIENATKKAKEKLWELEGYSLYKQEKGL